MYEFGFGNGFDKIRRVSGTPAPAPVPFTRPVPDAELLLTVDGDSNAGGMVVSYPAGNPDDTIYERKPSMTNTAGVQQIPGSDATVVGMTPSVPNSEFTPTWGTGGATSEDRVSLAECLAREMKARIPANLGVTVVQRGRGGISVMLAGANTVQPNGIGVGGLYYEADIADFISAFNTLKAGGEVQYALHVGAKPSNDGTRNTVPYIDETAMTAALRNMITDTRARVPEGSEVPYAWMGLMPGISTGSSTAVRNALVAAAAAESKSAVFIPAGTGSNDNLHPVPNDLAQVASDICDWWLTQPMQQKVGAFTIPQVNDAPVSTEIESDTFFPRIGPDVPVTVSVVGALLAVSRVDDPTNFGSWATSHSGRYWGDPIKVKLTTPAGNGVTTTVTVTITGPVDSRTADFVVVTEGGTTSFIMAGSTSIVTMNGKTVAAGASAYQEA